MGPFNPFEDQEDVIGEGVLPSEEVLEGGLPEPVEASEPQVTPAELNVMLQAGLSQRKEREQMWDAMRGYYKMTYKGRRDKPWPDAANVKMPVIRPKVDAVAGMVTDTIFSQRPIVTAKTGGESEIPEKVVQLFLEESLAERRHRVAVQTTGWAGRGVLKCTWSNDMAHPVLKHISLSNMVAYPADLESMEYCHMLGDCYYRSRQEIQALIDSGDYNGEMPVTSDDPSETRTQTFPEADRAAIHQHSSSDQDQDSVRLYDLYIKAGEGWDLYVFSDTTETIVHYEQDKHPHKHSPYFAYGLFDDDSQIWPDTSIATLMESLQQEIDHAANNALDAADWMARPSLLSPDQSPTEDAFKRFIPGSWVQSRGMGEATPVMMGGSLEPYGFIIEMFLRFVDSISRISQNATGQELKSGATATEVASLAQGTQAGVDDYTTNIGATVEDLAGLMWEMALKHKDEWLERHGESIEATPEELQAGLIDKPVRWEITGRNVGAAPNTQIQLLTMVVQLFAGIEGSGLDVYEAARQTFMAMERMGVIKADSIQLPQDPGQIVAMISELLQVPVEIVAAKVQEARQISEQIQNGQGNDQEGQDVGGVPQGIVPFGAGDVPPGEDPGNPVGNPGLQEDFEQPF